MSPGSLCSCPASRGKAGLCESPSFSYSNDQAWNSTRCLCNILRDTVGPSSPSWYLNTAEINRQVKSSKHIQDTDLNISWTLDPLGTFLLSYALHLKPCGSHCFLALALWSFPPAPSCFTGFKSPDGEQVNSEAYWWQYMTGRFAAAGDWTRESCVLKAL